MRAEFEFSSEMLITFVRSCSIAEYTFHLNISYNV
jgi:hypothetical protein